MEKFENVTVVKKSNIYFDGKVTSRTIEFSDGSVKSLGIMMEGSYTFGTNDAEIMEIIAGEVEVKLKDAPAFVTYKAGDTFSVEANSSFDIVVTSLCDYCCSYIKG